MRQTQPPTGEPFDSESARKGADGAWRAKRETVLRECGLWETWRSVPPKRERDEPLAEYLPGGAHYDVE